MTATDICEKVVSIHAPVRGATEINYYDNPWFNVSIHAPVRGATVRQMSDKQYRLVSIHAPVRGATTLRQLERAINGVSIHAPVRGATRYRCSPAHPPPRFNPRAREGRDYGEAEHGITDVAFQSTRP